MRIAFLGNFGVDYSSESHHKKTLQGMGHQVFPLQEGVHSAEAIKAVAETSDLFVWVHTHGWKTPSDTDLTMVDVLDHLKNRNVPSVTYHLDLWFGLQRQKDLEQDEFYKHIGHFFTVDKLMADWFNDNTEVKGHYLHAGVYEQECYLAAPSFQFDTYKHDVIFVGSRGYHPEWQYRPQLIDWLRETYGGRFTHIGGDGQIPTTRGQELNTLYADSKIAIGDSLCINFEYPHYWSDRVYETLGRGGFMIHPYIEGMETDFEDGKHLVFYKFGDFDDLKAKIDYYLEHDDEREKIRLAGHEHVKANHTYRQRWEAIIKEVSDGSN
ncbi:MAG: glycosyltransferase [Candidatus Paceibacterota bacterium]|jgi:hypothetical protein